MDLLDESISPQKIIWYLAWPTVLEQLLITMVQYVDVAIVGSLGESAPAAIAVSASVTWLINGIFAAFSVGFSVLVGRSIGAKDYDYAKRLVRQSFIAIVLVGAIISGITLFVAQFLPKWMGADPSIWGDATSYLSIIGVSLVFNMSIMMCSAILRCSGDTRTPLVFTTATNILNVILNLFFVFPTRAVSFLGLAFTMPGMGMGVSGSATATAISIAFSGIMLPLMLFVRKHPIRISLRDKIRFDGSIWRKMIKLATPVALERVTLSSGQIVMTAIVTRLGTTALTAHYLAITAESLTYMPAFGFAAAATALVAQSLGAKKPDLGYKYGKLCTWCGIIFMSAMGVVLFLFAQPLVSIFTQSEAVASLGAQVLRLEAFAQPFFAAGIVSAGALRGGGDTKWPFYVSLISMWGVRLGIAYVCAHVLGLGLFGAWIGMVADLTVNGCLLFRRYRSKKWIHGNTLTSESLQAA